MTDQIAPHGGALVNRRLRGDARDAAIERAPTLPQIEMSTPLLADLELIADGGFSPLTGFMTRPDYDTTLHDMRLASGLPWTIPVTLTLDGTLARRVRVGQSVSLTERVNGETRFLAILDVSDKFTIDKEREARLVYRTTEQAHPGVARLYAGGDIAIGGDIHLINLPAAAHETFRQLRRTPQETRRLFAERAWKQVVGFQTRNPIHRAHEYIQKAALEIVDGLLLHPLIGATKPGDIPADVRIQSYQAILEAYYPASRVLLAVFPAAMRYAGPREAVFHAIARKNYGCTHFIVGRDHAGVGKYYGTYDAQRIFDEFAPEEIGIIPLRFEHAFFCRECQAIVTAKTCPHADDSRVFLSGTQVRERLSRGERLPDEFTRPEVGQILLDAARRSQML